jgi:hypothetical protein
MALLTYNVANTDIDAFSTLALLETNIPSIITVKQLSITLDPTTDPSVIDPARSYTAYST